MLVHRRLYSSLQSMKYFEVVGNAKGLWAVWRTVFLWIDRQCNFRALSFLSLGKFQPLWLWRQSSQLQMKEGRQSWEKTRTKNCNHFEAPLLGLVCLLTCVDCHYSLDNKLNAKYSMATSKIWNGMMEWNDGIGLEWWNGAGMGLEYVWNGAGMLMNFLFPCCV